MSTIKPPVLVLNPQVALAQTAEPQRPKVDVPDPVIDLLQAHVEPPRVYRRLHSLRGWGHGETEPVFPGGARASGADGVRAHPGTRVAVGGDHLDRREDRVCGRDAAELGATGRA